MATKTVTYTQYKVYYSSDASHGREQSRLFSRIEDRNAFMNKVRAEPGGRIHRVTSEQKTGKRG